MQNVLSCKNANLWFIIQGTLTKPIENLKGEPGILQDIEDGIKFAAKDMGEYSRANVEARSTILSSLGPAQQALVDSEPDARGVWNKLRENYAQNIHQQIASLEAQLANIYQGNDSVEMYAFRIEKICRKLDHVKSPVNRTRKLRAFLRGLAPQHEVWRKVFLYHANLIHRKEGELTDQENVKALEDYERAIQTIQGDEVEQKSFRRGAPTSHALQVSAEPRKRDPKRTRGKTGDKKDRPVKHCTNCKRDNHNLEDCFLEGGPKYRPRNADRSSGRTQNNARSHLARLEEDDFCFTLRGKPSPLSQEWLVDSGASKHMSGDRSIFANYTRMPRGTQVFVADSRGLRVLGTGEIHLTPQINGKPGKTVRLTGVLHVKGLTQNLFSVPQVQRTAGEVSFPKDGILVYDKQGKLAIQGKLHRDQNYLDATTIVPIRANLVHQGERSSALEQWHKRLGHLNTAAVIRTAKMTTGIVLPKETKPLGACDTCIAAKHTKAPFVTREPKTTKPLELVHADLAGPFPIAHEGERYYLLMVDDYSRYCFGDTLENKSDAFGAFQRIDRLLAAQTDYRIKRLRTDNGGEFTSHAFSSYLEARGIVRELTAPYTPQSNGLAERTNGIMGAYIRSMLSEARLDQEFWAYAFKHALKLRNVSANKRLKDVTPYEVFHGNKPDLSGFRTFGSKVGVFDPETSRAFTSRNVIFDESDRSDERTPTRLPSKTVGAVGDAPLVTSITLEDETEVAIDRGVASSLSEETIPPPSPRVSQTANNLSNRAARGDTTSTRANEPEPTSDTEDEDSTLPPPQPHISIDLPAHPQEHNSDSEEDVKPNARYPSRARYPPPRLGDYARKVSLNPSSPPQTIKQAKERGDWPLWKAAIDAELRSHDENNTWTLIDRPKDRSINIVSCKWVFVIKKKADGSLDKYKARLVARGFTQRYGYDYDETFSPVVKATTLRLVVAIAAAFQWEIVHWDAVIAFLNGTLSVEVYMNTPPGFETPDKVCRLNKALYGLKQAGREWYIFASKALQKIGFTRIPQDHCLFFLNRPRGRMLLALYVDDIVATAENPKDLPWLREQIQAKFKITDQGPLSSVLNVNVSRSPRGTQLGQPGYIDKILDRFQMTEAKPAFTPLPTGGIAQPEEPDYCSPADVELYQQLIGSVNYLACYTRPDISFAVQALSRHLAHPTSHSMTAAKHLLKYLKTTKDYRLFFPSVTSGSPITLEVYTDADFANQKSIALPDEAYTWKNGIKLASHPENVPRKSVTGMITLLNGSPISWLAKQQPVIATSTQMAEYIAGLEGGKEAFWLRDLLISLNLWKDAAIPLWIDNQAAIQLCKNPVLHKATKHIDTMYHKIREWAADGIINVKHVATDKQKADMLTKPLSRAQIEETCKSIGMQNLQTPASSQQNESRVAEETQDETRSAQQTSKTESKDLGTRIAKNPSSTCPNGSGETTKAASSNRKDEKTKTRPPGGVKYKNLPPYVRRNEVRALYITQDHRQDEVGIHPLGSLGGLRRCNSQPLPDLKDRVPRRNTSSRQSSPPQRTRKDKVLPGERDEVIARMAMPEEGIVLPDKRDTKLVIPTTRAETKVNPASEDKEIPDSRGVTRSSPETPQTGAGLHKSTPHKAFRTPSITGTPGGSQSRSAQNKGRRDKGHSN